MLLGKRPRPPMRRTTSMTEFVLDLDNSMDVIVDAPQPSNLPPHHHQQYDRLANNHVTAAAATAAGMLSPRNNSRNRRSSVDLSSTTVIRTAPFLKACGLCKRRLGPGRDIYMYRGEVAFCSLECRQELINEEERKEKCSLTSIKTETQGAIAATAGGSEASSNGGSTRR